MNRRQLLNAVGTGAVVVAGISGKGIAQNDNLSIQIKGPVRHQGSVDFQPEGLITTRHSLEIGITGQLSLGGDSDRYIQVRNEDTGSNVLIIPEQEFTNVGKISLQNVVGDDRQLRPEDDNLILNVDDEFMSDIAFSIDGDADTYESGGVFSTFSVGIVEGRSNPTVLAETENTIRGVGWKRGPLNQEGTSGNSTISFDVDDPLNTSWHVEFRIRDENFNSILGPTKLENTGDKIEGTIDLSGLSSGTYERWSFDVYPSETQTDDGDAIIGASGILSEQNIVVTEGNDASVQIKNVAFSPEPVDSESDQHTLSFDAKTVSADGNENDSTDKFTVNLPERILLESVDETRIDNPNYDTQATMDGNTIKFTVDPTSSDQESVDLSFEVDMTLSTDENS